MHDSKTTTTHAAAQRALSNYEATGAPFSLFLSSWSIDEVDEFVPSVINESHRKVEGRIGLERKVRILLRMEGLETMAVYRKGDDARIANPEEWPALTLGDDEWQARVAPIAAQADLITLFWGVTTPGLTDELKICLSGMNALKTVAVVRMTPLQIRLSQLHKSFPRVVLYDEIPPLPPEFTPLVERMKALARLDPTIRSKLADPEERLRRFPLPPPGGRFDRELWVEHGGRPRPDRFAPRQAPNSRPKSQPQAAPPPALALTIGHGDIPVDAQN